MFERYTEKARRVVFFGRYEAAQVGSPYIETEHLLLGLVREDKALTNRFLCSHVSAESIRRQIEGHTTIRQKLTTSVDLPLSNECKRVLAYAADEAARLAHKRIGTEHLLLGLLREENCFAAEILHECGLRLSNIREEVAASGRTQPQGFADGAMQTPVTGRRQMRAWLVLVGFLVGALCALLFRIWPFSFLAYSCPFCFSFDFDAGPMFLVVLASAFALMNGSLYGLIGFTIGHIISRIKNAY